MLGKSPAHSKSDPSVERHSQPELSTLRRPCARNRCPRARNGGLPSAGLGGACEVAGAKFSVAQPLLPALNGNMGTTGGQWLSPASSLCPDTSRSPSRFIIHSASPPRPHPPPRLALSRWPVNTAALFCGPACWPLLSKQHASNQHGFTEVSPAGFRNHPGKAWEEQPAVSLLKISSTQ